MDKVKKRPVRDAQAAKLEAAKAEIAKLKEERESLAKRLAEADPVQAKVAAAEKEAKVRARVRLAPHENTPVLIVSDWHLVRI